MASYDLNDILKRKAQSAAERQSEKEMDLGDAARVKVLSPMRQVMKRFFRNRLAMFGLITLAVMFVFAFIGPIFYPYGQSEAFEKYDTLSIYYAHAGVREDYTGYDLNSGVETDGSVMRNMNSFIRDMGKEGADSVLAQGKDGAMYIAAKLGEKIYSLNKLDTTLVATAGSTSTLLGTLSIKSGEMEYVIESPGEDFASFARSNIKGKEGTFEYNGETYSFTAGPNKTYDIFAVSGDGLKYYGEELGEAFEAAVNEKLGATDTIELEGKTYLLHAVGEEASEIYLLNAIVPTTVYSVFAFDPYVAGATVSQEFKAQALYAAYTSGTFTADGQDYTIAEEDGTLVARDASGEPRAELNDFVVTRADGKDTMELGLKHALRDKANEVLANGESQGSLQYSIPQQSEDGKYVYDENGELLFTDAELIVNRKDTGEYEVRCNQIIRMIDKFAAPTSAHWLGTDGDGFDVLARIMYGGRISLMVGFIVVILEIVLGIIMGGLAGYFGGWVDNIIMRLVDIFYCLPSMPIMIIIGTMMDAVRMDTYPRLMVMMAALGVMGWAGIARIVRGQILSLREQEFMTATEATGLPVKRRIFRHLIPNVMPQLIVIATMGLGSVILTESTLSFLGLGVKHPLATWGTIINSVSTLTQLESYAFIWIPVGLLICLTVIAFNFVGDGLRDAFDPKAKR